MNFLHTYLPDPIFWQFSFIAIRWYGLLIFLALVTCLFLVLYLAKKNGAQTKNGFEMLGIQAEYSWEIWNT